MPLIKIYIIYNMFFCLLFIHWSLFLVWFFVRGRRFPFLFPKPIYYYAYWLNVNLSTFDVLQNGLSQDGKDLLDVMACFGWSSYKRKVLLRGRWGRLAEIRFVADYYSLCDFLRIVVDLFEPEVNTFEWIRIIQIIYQNDAYSIFIVSSRDSTKWFLPCLHP